MRNVLFISPDFFGHYKTIAAAISRKGLNPIWLNQLPATNILTRILFRFAPKIGYSWADRYFAREMEKHQFVELILIVKGEGVSAATIAKMRQNYPNAKIVLYLWDSLANSFGALDKIRLCDIAYSFDPLDCDRNQSLKHLPMFYSEKVESPAYIQGYAAFIGTLHSNRYQLIKLIGAEIERVTSIKPFLYFYYPNRVVFMILRLVKRGLRGIKLSDVHFEPVPRAQYDTIQAEAEIIIDISHPKQSGLTMRPFEALGAGRKLITNNKIIMRYDFYRPENCYVIDGGECHELCVSGPVHAGFRYGHALKRSSNMIAN